MRREAGRQERHGESMNRADLCFPSHPPLAGDCYIAACGILEKDEDGFYVVSPDHDELQSALNVMDFAKAILEGSKEVLMPHNNEPVVIRIGIHTGPCVS